MIEQLADFPENVAAFACHGHVTKVDYESVLIPDLNKRLESHDKIRIYYETAPDFDGFDAGAMWDDTKVGFRHFLRWEKFAVVTDVGSGSGFMTVVGWVDLDNRPSLEDSDTLKACIPLLR